MAVEPKVLKTIRFSTKDEKFLENAKLKFSFVDYDQDKKKICKHWMEGSKGKKVDDRNQITSQVNNWKDHKSIDILFELFYQKGMSKKRMFRVNFNLLFIRDKKTFQYEDVDEPSKMLPLDFEIELFFEQINDFEIAYQWSQTLKNHYIQLDLIKKKIATFNKDDNNFYF